MEVQYTASAEQHFSEIRGLVLTHLSSINNIPNCVIDYIEPDGIPEEGIFYIMLPGSAIGVVVKKQDTIRSAEKIMDLVVYIWDNIGQ